MRTFLIALLTALVTGFAGAFGGDLATKALRVSNMEGGRGMLIAFVILPAAAIGGMIVGILVARRFPDPGFAGFLKAQGIALGVAVGLVALVTGISVATAPRVPTIEGKTLALEFELRFPDGRVLPDSAARDGFSILMTGPGDDRSRHLAELRWEEARTAAGHIELPATAYLRTSSRRSLVINDGPDAHYWFDLPLRGAPRPADTTWTDWWPAPGQPSGADIKGSGGFQMRWRVRLEETP